MLSHIRFKLLYQFFILVLNLNGVKDYERQIFLVTAVFNILFAGNFWLDSFTDGFSFVLFDDAADWLTEWGICAKSCKLDLAKITIGRKTHFASCRQLLLMTLFDKDWGLLKAIGGQNGLNLKRHHDLNAWAYVLDKIYWVNLLVWKCLFFLEQGVVALHFFDL